MKDQAKTLIIISPGFPKNESDSTCLTAQQIFVRALNKNFPELNIEIIALQYPYHNERYSWFGNKVIPLNGKGFSRLVRPLLWMKANHILRQVQKETNVCGVLSLWCQEAALIGRAFAKKNRITHKIWIMGQDARKSNFLVRWIRPQADELVALSDFLADEFHRNHNIRPATVVPNAVEPQLYENVPREKKVDIIGAGSLISLKQFAVLIDVAKNLLPFYPGLKVKLVGTGPEKTKLEEHIKTHQLEHNITLTGELDHQTTIGLMAQSKILLHPSSYEGYSTVCLEALYAGCHVVSFTHAENSPVDHWHTVKGVDEMTLCCRKILDENQPAAPVLVHSMNDSAKKMFALFNQLQ
jgi:glycosyltransferase involved in cell wall biosynthesis